MPDLFKPLVTRGPRNNRKRVKSDKWHGKLKLAPGRWRKVPLYTDKRASEKRLAEMQQQIDRGATGVVTTDTDRLRLPIAELKKEYLDHLRARRCTRGTVRIAEWQLDRMIELGKWRMFHDITTPPMQKMLKTLEDQDATASYRNGFIKRAKAFVNWALPDGWVSPLAKLSRVREKGAKQTRGRRSATVDEAAAFMATWKGLPGDRGLVYALAMLNGLRRNEIHWPGDERCLKWGQVHLDAPIPFLELPQKHGDGNDVVALHPYVVTLLRQRTRGMPAVPVVRSVPDIKTVKKDLKRAKVEFIDQQLRRLDFHALRHTFSTALDRTGCSRATQKRLMRHASGDITDGYSHAELAEMLVAIARVPSPTTPAVQVKTGTDDAPVRIGETKSNGSGAGATTGETKRDQGRDQAAHAEPRTVAQPEAHPGTTIVDAISNRDQQLSASQRGLARPDLNERKTRDIVEITRPSTQVV